MVGPGAARQGNTKKGRQHNMQLITLQCTGTTGLLMHNPASMAPSNAGKLDTKRIPTPEVEAAAGRYVTDDGKYMRFPMQGFKSSFVSGGVGRRIGKRSATAVLKATIFPSEKWVMLLHPTSGKPIKADDYTIDVQSVVVQKSRILRARPLVVPWRCMVTFEVDDSIDRPDILVEIGNLAGRMVGVGDFRPATGGSFGRYEVSLV
jgi:hypothetical protein